MDGNKDEAHRCIDIAVQSFSEGKIEKAEKFLLKAEKLFPTQRAKELLAKVKSGTTTGAGKTSNSASLNHSASGENADNDGPRKRKNSDSRHAEPEYSKDQLDAVRKVKSCRNYYEILSVSKEATDSEIKKSYKKLALLLHPDKNKAPGASDAFKAVGNAAAVLTDAEKRKQYDLYGINETHSSGHGVRRDTYEYAYARGFQAEVSPEDLFNMFFGGGFAQQNVYMRQQRRRQQHRDDGEHQSNSSALINFLPILLLIGLSMISSFFISDPIYSLTPSHKYAVKRETNRLKVPYYVKNNFHAEYQGSVGRLEESVEEDFIDHLKYSCSRERNYRDSMLAKARSFGDRELFRKAQNINMPSCDNLQNYLNT
ncbi:dnaJ homolog subfamily B member 12 [Anastrepha ludens]|uniref:dnaJ homolog subfamily B member 12 n=1 Tax=Anastrepha ludens TaxID=28586 RepID=UPI0023B1FAE5|nr:dnaJ homolog subfamily B member 12 [Anastrepha ludens]